MNLRLCFENKAGVNIDEADVFRHYAENYLSGFDVKWAGSVSVPHVDTKTRPMEPLWQYLISDASTACRDYLIEYLDRNPMAGYFVHVYEFESGTGDQKIH
ncbi:hypothetical protein [uncultured Sneathiella sp.]|jgi:hypothetical protein|uniref:hypothetical protein n=1 Tax=uncultured Sneathiella sp. TaxID=879315 RepID=UPI0030DCE615|tara:strand:- start:1923 stop:2225 length:303 start_codon:yes stop_codon:yes gene_type:complete